MQPADELGELIIGVLEWMQLSGGANETISEDNEVFTLEAVVTEGKHAVDEHDIEEELELHLGTLALRRERPMDNLNPAVYAFLHDTLKIVCRKQYLKECVSHGKWACKGRRVAYSQSVGSPVDEQRNRWHKAFVAGAHVGHVRAKVDVGAVHW